MEDVEIINQRLKDQYGCKVDNNLPTFRLTWSTGVTEKRFGVFEIYSESGDIFLREERGIQECLKYPVQDVWVLEELRLTAGNPYLESVMATSYEPLWVFGLAGSDPIPIWRAIALILKHRLTPSMRKQLTKKDFDKLEKEAIEKEKLLFKDMLRDDLPDIPYQLAHGLAVTVPENYRKGDSNG